MFNLPANFVVIPLLGLFLLAASASSHAQSGGDPIYIPLSPPFVVNYGGTGRLKYLKAELSVRVDSVKSAAAVRHHHPLIRNSLILLLSRQTEESVNTQEGKEQLRQLALAEINALLVSEDGDGVEVTDLLFNSFVVQR